MKVEIKKYHAVAEWKWNLPPGSDDTCGICRVVFESTCAKCKYPGEDCPIVVGECKHCFHMHCITDWIQSESSQGRCPMCRQVFREKVADTHNNSSSNNPRTPSSAGSGGQGRSAGTTTSRAR